MDNNSNFGVTFINNTDQLYRYAASRDILFEQLFTAIPIKGLEIMAGLTYQYSGNLPQTNFLETPFRESKYSFFSTKIDLLDTLTNNYGFNPLVYHNFSVFSQAYYSFKSFRFMGGVRFDDNSRYGMSLSPRLAGMYIMNPRTSFRGSVSFAYKAPASSLEYQSLAVRAGKNLDSLLYLSIPNTHLKPEQYMAVELGLIRKSKKGFNFNLSLYYNEIRNNIIDQKLPVEGLGLPRAVTANAIDSVIQRVNAKNSVYRLYGVQATFKANDIVKSVHLNGELSLTFAKHSSDFPEILQIATDYLNNFKLIPKHNGQLKISLRPTSNLYVQVSSTWSSSWLRVIIPVKSLYEQLVKDYDGFYSMDIVADYRIGTNLHSFIRVTNILGERYGGSVFSGTSTPLPYNPQTGRSISFGLTYTLN
jgi:outer membrane receptor for ferrienterochelin and colicin